MNRRKTLTFAQVHEDTYARALAEHFPYARDEEHVGDLFAQRVYSVDIMHKITPGGRHAVTIVLTGYRGWPSETYFYRLKRLGNDRYVYSAYTTSGGSRK